MIGFAVGVSMQSTIKDETGGAYSPDVSYSAGLSIIGLVTFRENH